MASVSSTTLDQRRSPFFRLPAELRTYIYEIVALSHPEVTIFTYWDRDAFTAKPISKVIPLLSTCKQIRDEAYDIVFENITFMFRPHWQSEFGFTNRGFLSYPSHLSIGAIEDCTLLREMKNVRIHESQCERSHSELKSYHMHAEVRQVLQEECDLKYLAFECSWPRDPKFAVAKPPVIASYKGLISRVKAKGGKVEMTMTSPGYQTQTEPL